MKPFPLPKSEMKRHNNVPHLLSLVSLPWPIQTATIFWVCFVQRPPICFTSNSHNRCHICFMPPLDWLTPQDFYLISLLSVWPFSHLLSIAQFEYCHKHKSNHNFSMFKSICLLPVVSNFRLACNAHEICHWLTLQCYVLHLLFSLII